MNPDDYNRMVAELDADIAARPVRPLLDLDAINAIAAGAGGVSAGAGFDPIQDTPEPTGQAPQAWPELIPLAEDCGDTEAPKAFPFAALGEVLGCAAQAIAATVQAPDAMAGGSVLAAASLAAQPLADVVLPHGQRKPLSLFIVTSGASGDRKSGVDEAACLEIERRSKEESRRHFHAMERYQNEKATLQKGDPEPPEPKLQALTVGNATVEGAARLLKGQSSVGVFSAEGGEVLGGHSMRDSNRMAAMAFFLKAWGGESLNIMRGGAGFTSLLGRRVSMSIMVQPLLLGQLLSDPLADGQGFLARCLISQPATLAGHRPYLGENPADHPAVQAYAQRMAQLLDTRPELWEGGDGYELKPRGLTFDPDARALWIAFYNAIEAEQADGKELADARPFASKAAEQAARIAGVMALFNDPGALEVGEAAMDGAIQIMGFYLNEHLRLMGTGKQQQTDKRLRTLLEWMQGQDAIVTTRHIARLAPRAVRSLKTQGVMALLDELAARGYIRPLGAGWEVRRGV